MKRLEIVIRRALTFNGTINLQLDGLLTVDSGVLGRLFICMVVIACWCCPEACL